MKGIECVKNHAQGGEIPGSNVLVPASDRFPGSSHAFLALEGSQAHPLAEPGQNYGVVPKGEQAVPQPGVGQMATERIDLRALPCPVDTRETYQCHAVGSHTLEKQSSGSNQCAPGGLPWVASVRATTVPSAAPAPTIAPTLMTMARARCCFAGAIAIPAGSAAVIPLTPGASAAAVPTGRCGFCSSVAPLCALGSAGEELAEFCAAEEDT